MADAASGEGEPGEKVYEVADAATRFVRNHFVSPVSRNESGEKGADRQQPSEDAAGTELFHTLERCKFNRCLLPTALFFSGVFACPSSQDIAKKINRTVDFLPRYYRTASSYYYYVPIVYAFFFTHIINTLTHTHTETHM